MGRVHVICGGEMEVYVSAKQSLTKRAVVSSVSSPLEALSREASDAYRSR